MQRLRVSSPTRSHCRERGTREVSWKPRAEQAEPEDAAPLGLRARVERSIRALGPPPDLTYEHLTAGLPEKSLMLFSKSNWLRKGCIYITRSRFFESFILVVILANCIFMAMQVNNKPGFTETRT